MERRQAGEVRGRRAGAVQLASKGKDQKSKQGNRELHSIPYFLAIQQVQVAKVSKRPRNPVFHNYYQRKINEGKTKKQALVCVMRRLVNIVYGMMKHRTTYVMPEMPEKEAVLWKWQHPAKDAATILAFWFVVPRKGQLRQK